MLLKPAILSANKTNKTQNCKTKTVFIYLRLRPVRTLDRDVADVLTEHEPAAREMAAVFEHWVVVWFPVAQDVFTEGALHAIRRARVEEASASQVHRSHGR